MKKFLRCMTALLLLSAMSLSVAAADTPMLIAANPAIKDTDATTPGTTDAATEEKHVPVKIDTDGNTVLMPITGVSVKRDDVVTVPEGMTKATDDNAESEITLPVIGKVLTVYFNTDGLFCPTKLFMNKSDDTYMLTLSASPDNVLWYDVHIKELDTKDWRTWEVNTVRDYRYFQADFITKGKELTLSTIAIAGKPVAVVEESAPETEETTAIPENAPVKDGQTNTTTTDAAVDGTVVVTPATTTDAAVEDGVEAEVVIMEPVKETALKIAVAVRR